MQDPVSVNDVQKLTGRVAALNRFILRAAERSLPFSKFSEVLRTFSGLKLRSKPSKDLKGQFGSSLTGMTHPQ
jgi:hypothetical protein